MRRFSTSPDFSRGPLGIIGGGNMLSTPAASAAAAAGIKGTKAKASMPGSGRGPVSWASLTLAGFVGLGAWYVYNQEKQRMEEQALAKETIVGQPLIGGPFTLVDADGIPRTDAYFRGQFVLLYFGFTRCPDICPSELVKIGKIADALDNLVEERVTPVFISVDPDRDTIKQIKEYSKDFHPRMHFLTGTKAQVEKVSRAYRVYFSSAEEVDWESGEDYLVDHSIVIYLNGPDGKFLDFFTQSTNVNDCVKRIVKRIQSYKQEKAK
eukprot:CAMPEP_0113950842 /NCGR_PEP_ID=MMETSP1339-20121228/82714_1 /TAXON_ID=94617 /ORGANISM="Fibrocapsa japonica" /LENGTH=265 /DNA_ID=CAMNT_0000958819 /DNA_START=145 /DNA_END=942 /DNA_ORIENTATION=+ /assembly_acc=CAM_ASM_000762